MLIASGTRIAADYAALGLTPSDATLIEPSSRSTCTNTAGNVVPRLSILLRVDARNASPAALARRCAQVNVAGTRDIGGRLDIEYHCEIHVLATERPAMPINVAVEAVRLDAELRALTDRDVCVLSSTDVQCAPCTSSDKLVARLSFVARGAECPRGAVRVPP